MPPARKDAKVSVSFCSAIVFVMINCLVFEADNTIVINNHDAVHSGTIALSDMQSQFSVIAFSQLGIGPPIFEMMAGNCSNK